MTVSVGKKVPALTGKDHERNDVALVDFADRQVVVYFYPKDNTSGCTREAEDFRDLYPAFRRRHCAILGVSRDSSASHARFRDKLNLPFSLIADSDEVWCQAFGVIAEKVLYGKRHLGVVRSTFLLGPDRVLRAEWRGIRVPDHAQSVLDWLGANQPAKTAGRKAPAGSARSE